MPRDRTKPFYKRSMDHWPHKLIIPEGQEAEIHEGDCQIKLYEVGEHKIPHTHQVHYFGQKRVRKDEEVEPNA